MSQEMQTCPSCGELVPNEYVTCVWCGFDLTAEHIRRAGITIDNRAAFRRMRGVVVDPLNTFKEIALLPDLRGGKMVFYGLGLMMTLNMIIILRKISDLEFNAGNVDAFTIGKNFSVSVRFLLNFAYLLVQPLVFLLIFIVVWKIAARILSALSKSFGGRGDREKIRSMIGYSMVPVLLGWTVAYLLRLLAPRVEAGGGTYDSIETAVISVSEQGFGVLSMIFLYIGWIWATILGIIGIKNVGRLSWVEAVVVAGIPYVLFMTIAL